MKKQPNILPLATKEAACAWVNAYLEELNKTFRLEKPTLQTVKVPLYHSKFKKAILWLLQLASRKRSWDPTADKQRLSLFDYSTIVPADDWAVYQSSTDNRIALPLYTTAYPYTWGIHLVSTYLQEDLQYGAQPIVYFWDMTLTGEGPLWVDKENGNVYHFGSLKHPWNYQDDFVAYKEGRETEFDWESPPNVVEKGYK